LINGFISFNGIEKIIKFEYYCIVNDHEIMNFKSIIQEICNMLAIIITSKHVSKKRE